MRNKDTDRWKDTNLQKRYDKRLMDRYAQMHAGVWYLVPSSGLADGIERKSPYEGNRELQLSRQLSFAA